MKNNRMTQPQECDIFNHALLRFAPIEIYLYSSMFVLHGCFSGLKDLQGSWMIIYAYIILFRLNTFKHLNVGMV